MKSLGKGYYQRIMEEPLIEKPTEKEVKLKLKQMGKELPNRTKEYIMNTLFKSKYKQ